MLSANENARPPANNKLIATMAGANIQGNALRSETIPCHVILYSYACCLPLHSFHFHYGRANTRDRLSGERGNVFRWFNRRRQSDGNLWQRSFTRDGRAGRPLAHHSE